MISLKRVVRYGFVPTLLAGLAGFTLTYGYLWSPPSMPVPEHLKAWEEMKEPDHRSLFLLKFSTEDDQDDILDDLLDSDDLMGFLEGDGDLGPSMTSTDAIEAALAGDASVVANAGFFGGGLVVNGQGHASRRVPIASIFRDGDALTLDFWFKANALPPAGQSAVLATMEDSRQSPLIVLEVSAEGQVQLKVAGEVRLEVPFNTDEASWNHLVLVWSQYFMTLMVNDRLDRAPAAHHWNRDNHPVSLELLNTFRLPEPDWLAGLYRQAGNRITVGGAPGAPGLVGVVDEVRLSRGERFFYRWDLAWLDRVDASSVPELAAPYFRNSDVLTRFRFDGTLEPEVLAAEGWGGDASRARFQPGVSGQALDLSQIRDAGFAIQGMALPPQIDGTIEFWFRPLDWDNFYRASYHGTDMTPAKILAQLQGERLRRPLRIMTGTPGSHARIPWTRIHPGAWTHVILSVEDGRTRVYLNGKPQYFGQVGLDRPDGRAPWDMVFANSNTLIDEFSIYPWGMSAHEAWNAYARWLPEADALMEPLPLFDIHFRYIAHSWSGVERLEIDIDCMPVDGVRPEYADVALYDASGHLLKSFERHPLESNASTTFVIRQPLDFGQYKLTVRSQTANGEVLSESEMDYVRERPEWYENTLGLERTVPSPWEPMELEGHTLSLWGRSVKLGLNGLPAEMVALDRELLAAPATFWVRLEGQEEAQALAGKVLEFTEVAGDRIAWKAEAGGDGLKAVIEGWMEFDGLVYVDVTLYPENDTHQDSVTVESLQIEFPMDPEYATQLIANGGGNNFRQSWIARMIPGAGEGAPGDRNLVSVWNSLAQPYPSFNRAWSLVNFMPHIWVGGDATGLYFGAENDKGWTVCDQVAAQEILRAHDAVVFRLNIIRESTIIPDEGHHFHFTLLPTPAKPEPDNWRHDVVLGGNNFTAVDSFAAAEMKTDPFDPQSGDSFNLEPRSWEHAENMSRQLRDRTGRAILYGDVSWPRPGPAFQDWNHDMFNGAGRIAWIPEFEDYFVWAMHAFLERGLVDGIYLDDVSVGYTLSLDGTAYAFDNERGRRPGFTALAQRRALMRLWRLFLAHDMEPNIKLHMTYAYEVPMFSFATYLYNAEIFSGIDHPKPRDAMHEWPAERIRILAGAGKWGAGHPFISTLPRSFGEMDANWVYRQVRAEDAVFMTADVPGAASPWRNGPNLSQVVRQHGIFDPGVKGYPFWMSDRWITVEAPEGAAINASLYLHDDRAYVFIANRDTEPREVTIQRVKDALFPDASRVTWRDLDPGLAMPESRIADAGELEGLRDGLESADQASDGMDWNIDDLMEGGTASERALEQLKLRVDGERATFVIRPRDYRLLEIRP